MKAWPLWQRVAKRIIDWVVSALLLILLAPLMALIAIAVWRTMGRPVLFMQPRPGLDGRPFVMSKFRTMRAACDDSGLPLPDGDRLTPLGRWLRRTSLDELPELWLVLIGKMSLVGPRPLLMRYLPRYTPRQAKRHAVRPGVTGWAQVNGRNTVSWEQRFELDVWYVEHGSLWLDLKILMMTLGAVLRREGISQEGHATMSEFMGSEEH